MKLIKYNIFKKNDRDAFINQVKLVLKKKFPIVFITVWYTILFYLFFGFLFTDYSCYMLGFSLAVYFLYEKLTDDFWEAKLMVAKEVK